jgi:hypothetical protein
MQTGTVIAIAVVAIMLIAALALMARTPADRKIEDRTPDHRDDQG